MDRTFHFSESTESEKNQFLCVWQNRFQFKREKGREIIVFFLRLILSSMWGRIDFGRYAYRSLVRRSIDSTVDWKGTALEQSVRVYVCECKAKNLWLESNMILTKFSSTKFFFGSTKVPFLSIDACHCCMKNEQKNDSPMCKCVNIGQ